VIRGEDFEEFERFVGKLRKKEKGAVKKINNDNEYR